MTEHDRHVAEAEVRSLCGQYGAAVVAEVMGQVHALPDMDNSDFASAIGRVVGVTLRAHLLRERARLADLRAGIAIMHAVFPCGPTGTH